MSEHLAGCDLLIAHISQPERAELQNPIGKEREIHLGYRGTIRLLKECKPKVSLIGEFWAGFADIRVLLVKALRERSGLNYVFPAGISLHMTLPTLDVECTECKRLTPFSRVKVAPPADKFGSLSYLCEKCMMS